MEQRHHCWVSTLVALHARASHVLAAQVPADAKVVEGPGLITGGPPVKLEGVEASVSLSTVVRDVADVLAKLALKADRIRVTVARPDASVPLRIP